ncbi:MAG: phosphoglycerate mutase family protein [Bacteroidetes bacterium]|nr:phosphoglycerate mutase family protein [Bacteroidota bacterium]
MNLFLIRHFESTKNVDNTLSSIGDTEPLTAKARLDCVQFSKDFKGFLELNSLSVNKINCTSSIRAKETASILANNLGNIHIESFKELKSTFAGICAGLSLEKINSKDPFFFKSYYLYKKGIYNLYNLDNQWNNSSKETKIDFEARVQGCFNKIINCNDTTVVIIAHRSPIIAILLYIARLEYNYSFDFYGKVDIDFGRVTWIQRDENERWDVCFVNEPITHLKING